MINTTNLGQQAHGPSGARWHLATLLESTGKQKRTILISTIGQVPVEGEVDGNKFRTVCPGKYFETVVQEINHNHTSLTKTYKTSEQAQLGHDSTVTKILDQLEVANLGG